ncbi:MAG: sigma-70 family RNA polymerase sigma factor [Endomicrobiia bacterium]
MGRYVEIVIKLCKNEIDEKSFNCFLKEIIAMFCKYAEIKILDSYAEALCCKALDTLLSKLEEFALKAENDTNFDRWFFIWLSRTVRNYAYKYKRIKNQEEILESELYRSDAEDNAEIIFVDKTDDVFSKISSEEFIQKFYSSLDETEKQVVKLKLQGLKQKEIAEKINKSEPTVCRIIKSITEKLKKLLEK